MNKNPQTRKRLIIAAILFTLTFICYLRVGSLNYIAIDDPIYIYNNPHVKTGITPGNIAWSITSAGYAGNWHPLTWMSHMLDYTLFGSGPAGHHFSSVLIHSLNAMLLFLLISSITGSIWRSAFIAALFALHPLNVESVAWISERKNVLSTFFWISTIWAYCKYAQKPGIGKYILVLLLFALGLMAKPMLVTLPMILLLLDYWPLQRINAGWKKLIWEKVPLLVLTAESCWLTLIAQKQAGYVRALTDYPMGVRIANAVVSYLAYLWKMIWPSKLYAMYPHPLDTLPVLLVMISGLAMAGITLAAIMLRKSRPHLFFGWMWYLVTLIPVIGIVQVGPQAMADRYAYVPLIGIFLIITWEAALIIKRIHMPVGFLAVPAAGILIALAMCTWAQTGTWRNSETLYGHASIAANHDPFIAWGWAIALSANGDNDAAIKHLQDISTNIPEKQKTTNHLLGYLLARAGRVKEAADEYRKSLSIDPKQPMVQNNLGVALGRMGKIDEAIEHLVEASHLDPNYSDPHHNLGTLLLRQGKVDQAIEEFNKALDLDPRLGDTRLRLAIALCEKDDYAGAWKEVHQAQEQGAKPDPKFIAYLRNKMPEPQE